MISVSLVMGSATGEGETDGAVDLVGSGRYTESMANTKKKSPIKKPPLRVTSTGGATHKQHKDRSTRLPSV